MQIKLRRYRNALITDGGGIIAFGLWSVIKCIMGSIIDPIDLSPEFASGNSTIDMIVAVIAEILFILMVVGIFMIHVYIGMSAYREGRNGKKGSLYLVVASLIALVVIAEMVFYLVPKDRYEDGFLSIAAAFCIDMTKAVILIDMLYSAIRSRRLVRQLEK